jgi:excisionase family DNA binding protein
MLTTANYQRKTIRGCELRKILGVTCPTFRKWIKEGRLPAPLPIPGKVLFDRRKVAHLLCESDANA